MEAKERADRTWWWVAAAAFAAIVLSCSVWFRRAPSGSVDLAVIAQIADRLRGDGFSPRESVRMRSESMIGPIPVSRILGTSTDSEKKQFERNGAMLTIGYEMKAQKAFNISVTATPTNITRAKQIARELSQVNPTVSVTVWTNTAAP